MNARVFFDTVAKMRYAQQQYFKTRSKEWLVTSKGFEKQIDDEIARVHNLEAQKVQEGGEQ